MPDFYGGGRRTFRDRFDTRLLADRMEGAVVRGEFCEIDKRFIAMSNIFFP